MSFLQDVHPEVTHALLGYVNADLDDSITPSPPRRTHRPAPSTAPRCHAKPPTTTCASTSPAMRAGLTNSVVEWLWRPDAGEQQIEFVLPFVLPPPPMQLPPAFVSRMESKKAAG
ncbi:hypothetical protein E2562_019586 [Oryza meyeriana var. granulata]|uniref:Uncharacterized protein n=1 Tax=Oryza meyeriana var. granulata TaxID=110450 RepID=A0A6G1EXA6_9ORYZ|nr:hypothetical protein E2562_019586 [Oryza meyeriana var. granulata]